MGGLKHKIFNNRLSTNFPLKIDIYEAGLLYEGIFNISLYPLNKTNIKVNSLDIINTLLIQICYHKDNHIQIKLLDANNSRYQIPEQYPFPFSPCLETINDKPESSLKDTNLYLDIDLRPDSFYIKVYRTATSEAILTLNKDLIYSNYYINFELELTSTELYGFGERTTALQYYPGTYSLFTLDRESQIEERKPGFNKGGHHPAYLNKEKPSGLYHLLYFRNSNAQELTITEDNKIKWTTIGGIIDLNVFVGTEDPQEVIEKYHKYIGGWAIPALWHLGYTVGKWGDYNSADVFENVFQKFKI